MHFLLTVLMSVSSLLTTEIVLVITIYVLNYIHLSVTPLHQLCLKMLSPLVVIIFVVNVHKRANSMEKSL